MKYVLLLIAFFSCSYPMQQDQKENEVKVLDDKILEEKMKKRRSLQQLMELKRVVSQESNIGKEGGNSNPTSDDETEN